MYYVDPKDLTQRENYKLLIGSIIPRPVAVVSTQSADGIVNIAPFSFFNIVSSEPVILSLAIQRKEGELKDTAYCWKSSATRLQRMSIKTARSIPVPYKQSAG